MTASEKRAMIAAKYKTIIGRNVYSQPRRDYCYVPYKDGKYYSDCSSSICYTYQECGLTFGVMNTVGMYRSTRLRDVPVTIKNGQIANPDELRVGDMLLFAGNDKSRKYAGYVGHVEMVGEITSKGKIWLYGHGSGNPKRHEMTAYCKTRFNTKSDTALGHRGLIRVRRFIPDDPAPQQKAEEIATVSRSMIRVTGNTVNVRKSPMLSSKILAVVKKGALLQPRTPDRVEHNWHAIIWDGQPAWISAKYAEPVTVSVPIAPAPEVTRP